jgi:hypothetical protein
VWAFAAYSHSGFATADVNALGLLERFSLVFWLNGLGIAESIESASK